MIVTIDGSQWPQLIDKLTAMQTSLDNLTVVVTFLAGLTAAVIVATVWRAL